MSSRMKVQAKRVCLQNPRPPHKLDSNTIRQPATVFKVLRWRESTIVFNPTGRENDQLYDKDKSPMKQGKKILAAIPFLPCCGKVTTATRWQHSHYLPTELSSWSKIILPQECGVRGNSKYFLFNWSRDSSVLLLWSSVLCKSCSNLFSYS